MGNLFSYPFMQLKIQKGHNAISRTEYKDFKVIKNVWQTVRSDYVYYGLFKNHPQYAKYFENESIPDFIQEAKVKKKFTVICDIASTLFVDYHDKPFQREYLLGYIAMVHKDMGLTLKDFQIFTGDLMEMLVTELPHLMTEQYIEIQMKYFNNLIDILLKLMDEYSKKVTQMLRTNTTMKKCCRWGTDPESQVIYGFPLKYWIYKQRYWEYRRLIWASVEADTLNDINPNLKEQKFKKLYSNEKPVEAKMISRKKRSTSKLVSSDSDVAHRSRRSVTRRRSHISQRLRKSWLSSKERKKKGTGKNILKLSRMEPNQKHDNIRNQRIVTDASLSSAKGDRNDDDPRVSTRSTALNASPVMSQKGANGKITSSYTARERKRLRNAIVAQADFN